MKKRGKTVGRVIGCILPAIVLIFVILIAIYHNAARMVWNNLTQTLKVADTSADWEGGVSYAKVQYADVSESDYVDIYVPDNVKNPPLLVMVHGGGFLFDDSQSTPSQLVYRYFRDKGYAVASVNYRLAQEASFPAAVQDVKACIRFLRANASKYGYSAGRIAIMGESAGGYLATMAAATSDEEFNDLPFIGEEELEETYSSQVQVLIDYYGAVELGDKSADWKESGVPNLVLNIANSWLSGDVLNGYEDCESYFIGRNYSELTADEAKIYEPAYYYGKNWTADTDIHVWIAHGDSDITVPIQQSERLYAALTDLIGEDRVNFRITPNSGHAGPIMYSDEELERVDNYLQQYLYGYALLLGN